MEQVETKSVSQPKRILRILIGILVAAVFSYFCFSNISWNKLSLIFSTVHPAYVVTGVFCFIAGHIIRINRWAKMLSMSMNKKVSYRQCYGPYVSCFAMNNVLPFRVGDLMRLFLFNKQLKSSVGVVTATIFIERLLDLLMVLIALSLALNIFSIQIGSFFNIGKYAIYMACLTIFLVIVFPVLATRPLEFFIHLVKNTRLTKLQKISDELMKLASSLKLLGSKKNAIKLIFLSLLAWIFEACMFICAAYALPSLVNPNAAFLSMPVGTLSTAIPAAPGYIGTFHFFVKESMSMLGNSDEAALGFAILTHAMLWLPLTIAGGIYLIFKKRGTH